MSFIVFVLIFFVLCGVIGGIQASVQKKKLAGMTPASRAAYKKRQNIKRLSALYGLPNVAMVCPHCQEGGQVHTKSVMKKKGVSGGKATGAILTGSVSLLATGLSRKELNTEAYCRRCRNVWSI